jgi:outer membrane receptor protein involved in Fe transport
MMDFAVGYALQTAQMDLHLHSVKLKLQVDNLLNHDVLVLSSVGSTPASNGYNVLPGINYFLTVSTEF